MKTFMRKINPNAEYIQLLPIRERKSKEQILNRHSGTINKNQSGMTGDKLIKWILDFVKKKQFREEKYNAVLIEDDKDKRYLKLLDDGTACLDKDNWIIDRTKLKEQIHNLYPDMKVIIFYAAPEIEAWFLADWNHSFGNVYLQQLTKPQNDLFSTKFRIQINKNVLKNYGSTIELYGYFDGNYKKLSEEIQRELEQRDFFEGTRYQGIKPVTYSKRIQGALMLENLEPDIVLTKCNIFFKEGYYALKRLGEMQ